MFFFLSTFSDDLRCLFFFFFFFRGVGGVGGGWFSSRWLFGTQLVWCRAAWGCRRPARASVEEVASKATNPHIARGLGGSFSLAKLKHV